MTASDVEPSPADLPNEGLRLTPWQIVTVSMLILGYAGYYLCRVHLSVSTPSLIEDHALGLTKRKIGDISSMGLLFYAAGKFLLGSGADILGGKKMFMVGMGGAILCSVLFGMSSTLPLFTAVWAMNRAVQAGGWASIVKISSRWFSYSIYGTIMGLISLSYLFGDFLSRLFLGGLLKGLEHNHVEHAWRILFFAAAGVLGIIFVACLFTVKETPAEVGDPEPQTNPENVYGEEGEIAEQTSIARLLLPLLTNPVFWVVCILSFGFTMVRETFNNWIPTYLVEVTHMKKSDAALWSSLFPLFGGFSVLIAGFLSDRMGHTGRARIILGGLILATPALLALAYTNFNGSPVLPIIAFGAIAFLMLGPYSFLAGAIGMDFGGKKGSATASGWIDGIGYIGGMLAGSYIGHVADNAGWATAFRDLAAIGALTTVAAAVYLWQRSRPEEGRGMSRC